VDEGQDAPGALWLLSGQVGLHKTLAEGRAVLFDLLLPIDVFRPAAADMASSCFRVTAQETSVVAFFTHAEHDQLPSRCRGLGPIVDLLEAARRSRQAERMLRIVQGRGEAKVAFLLLELALRADRRAVLAHQPCRVDLSQRAIGEMTGLSNVHVCRVMRALSGRGILRPGDSGTELRDIPALAELAQTEPAALAKAILI
jgi:CRP-like cAMP-binding protein